MEKNMFYNESRKKAEKLEIRRRLDKNTILSKSVYHKNIDEPLMEKPTLLYVKCTCLPNGFIRI
jgi:hypothetical protein